MMFYLGVSHSVSATGGRLAEVCCERCHCQYFYELSRIGKGRRTAHYGVGSGDAQQNAEAASLEQLNYRLDTEAELVPCPECSWVSQELIDGYALSQNSGLGKVAFGIGLFGSIVSLLCAWFVHVGPAMDHWMLPYLILLGPLASIGIGCVMHGWKLALRSRIDPNRDFPNRATSPAGTPNALVWDEGSQSFRDPLNHSEQNPQNPEWVEFLVGRDRLPQTCCGCLVEPTDGAETEHFIDSAMKIEIPRCASCARESRINFHKRFWIPITIGLVLVYLIASQLGMNALDSSIIVVGAVAAIFLWAGADAVASSRRAIVKVADLSRGVVLIKFDNEQYRDLTVSERAGCEVLAISP